MGTNLPTVLLLGDSITAACQEGATDWFYKANVSASRPLRPVPAGSARNKGVSSDTTTMMLARFQTDVLNVGTNWLIIYGGTNDVGAQSVATATTIANLQSMYGQALAAGMKVIACTIFPSDYMTTAGQKSGRATINAAIASYVSGHAGMYLCDWASTMESSPDVLNPAYSDETAGTKTHPNGAGATALAGILAPVLTTNVVPV